MIVNPPPWPNSARCAVAVTWDMDADSSLNYYNPSRADTLVATSSYVRYGPTIAVPRIVELARNLQISMTFCVPGWCIERYPDAVDLIEQGGHEIALHGYIHERPNELTPESEQQALDRALAAYEKHLRRRPKGWRAPSFAFSKNSLPYLVDRGFDYDASLMGDDIPYVISDGKKSLLELPSQWDLDDWPHYMHNPDFGYTMPISPPERVYQVFKAEFDAAWEYGGLWICVWHPFVSGRPSKIKTATRLMQYMQEKGGVWFARLDQIASHIRSLMNAGTWRPRIDRVPPYSSPIPEVVGLKKAT